MKIRELQPGTKYLEQSRENKYYSTVPENFDIYFGVVFDSC